VPNTDEVDNDNLVTLNVEAVENTHGNQMSLDNPDEESEAETTESKAEDEESKEVVIIDVNCTELDLNHARIGKMENFDQLVSE
jgi:hypothetical protein